MTNEVLPHPSISQDALIIKGLQFSLRAHQDQVRKVDGQPYFFHSFAVGRLLIEAGSVVEVVVAGLLHDVVEDTPVTIGDIEKEFGTQIAEWVNGVTEEDKSEPWRARKQAILKSLATAEPEVVLISLADKRDNLRSLRAALKLQGPVVWSKFNRPKPDQRWYHHNLISIFTRRVYSPGGQKLLKGLRSDFAYLFDQ